MYISTFHAISPWVLARCVRQTCLVEATHARVASAREAALLWSSLRPGCRWEQRWGSPLAGGGRPPAVRNPLSHVAETKADRGNKIWARSLGEAARSLSSCMCMYTCRSFLFCTVKNSSPCEREHMSTLLHRQFSEKEVCIYNGKGGGFN